MDDKKYISRVKLPENETPYFLKDLDARTRIALLEELFSGEIIINCGSAPIEEEDGDAALQEE